MVSNLPCSYNRHEAASVRVAASFLAVQRHRAAYRSDPIDQRGAMGVISKGEFFISMLLLMTRQIPWRHGLPSPLSITWTMEKQIYQ